MILNITGFVQAIDKYDKLVLSITDIDIINSIINNTQEYRIPYKKYKDSIDCYINIPISKYYIKNLLEKNISKEVKINITLKKYQFDNKRGTSLILKSVEEIIE
jgi:hypothetical protein